MYKRQVLEGPSAFAVAAEDATAPARILAKFAKTAPALEIKAGVVEGTFYDAEGMKAISAVPVSYTHLDVYKRQHKYFL